MNLWPWAAREPVDESAAADIALTGVECTARTIRGNQPCSALRCTATTGMPCTYVDRRDRRCKTAWCPTDREVVNDVVLCTLHAHTMRGIEHEFGSAVHPDVDSRTVPIIHWMAAAAADDIIATLNVLCSLRGEVLVSEPVRRVYHSVDRRRVWEKQWKTLSTTGVSMRVSICSEERRANEILIKVNGEDVNVVPPPWNQALAAPNDADLEWLFQEVLMPIGQAVERWMVTEQESEGAGYVPPSAFHGGEAGLAGRRADGWTVSGGSVTESSSLTDASHDEAGRAHFVYGVEELQALRVRDIGA